MKLSDLRTFGQELRKALDEDQILWEGIAAANPAVVAEEPWGVVQVVTPSGLAIYYQAGPKRLYRIGEMGSPGEMEEVPSASTVLQVLEKGGLSWWGMKVGASGIVHLLKRGCLFWDGKREDPCLVHKSAPNNVVTYTDVKGDEGLVDLLKSHNLTVNHVKDKAADRGTNVHSALELYAEEGVMPDPDLYPENEAGYVAGLVAFLKDTQPVVEHSELMVASTAGFAGRFDLVAALSGEAVVKTYPKRTDVRQPVEGRWLLDLKTSKGVYASYHLQVAGYEGAMEECGYGTVDHTGIVRVTNDGRYELVAGRASFEAFLAVLNTYRIVKRLEGKA